MLGVFRSKVDWGGFEVRSGMQENKQYKRKQNSGEIGSMGTTILIRVFFHCLFVL